MTNEKDLTKNHMARLGAGLLILKNSGAPLNNPVSYRDRVTFEFEDTHYQILPVQFREQERAAIFKELITIVKQHAGSCPGHAQLEMFAALEAAAGTKEKNES